MPFSQHAVDASLASFIDDMFRISLLDDCRASHAAHVIGTNDRELNHMLRQLGIDQHLGKLEFTGVFFLRAV